MTKTLLSLYRLCREINVLVAKAELPQNQWVDVGLSELDDDQVKALWDMYEHSYRDIGLSVSDLTHMKTKYKVTKLINIDEDEDPDAFILYKQTRHGNKLALMGTDGSKNAKRAVMSQSVSLLRGSGWYCEASHRVADIIEGAGIHAIDDESVVREVMGTHDITWLGDGKYTRTLGPVGTVQKSLYGNPHV